MTDNKCRGKIWNGYHFYRCGKNAKHQRDGKWYCGTHDPVKVVEKRKAHEAKWDSWETECREKATKRKAAADLQTARANAFLEIMQKNNTSDMLNCIEGYKHLLNGDSK